MCEERGYSALVWLFPYELWIVSVDDIQLAFPIYEVLFDRETSKLSKFPPLQPPAHVPSKSDMLGVTLRHRVFGTEGECFC